MSPRDPGSRTDTTDRKFNAPNEVFSERGQREAWDEEHGAAGLA